MEFVDAKPIILRSQWICLYQKILTKKPCFSHMKYAFNQSTGIGVLGHWGPKCYCAFVSMSCSAFSIF